MDLLYILLNEYINFVNLIVKEESMGPVAKHIKKRYEEWKLRYKHCNDLSNVCSNNPFGIINIWMYFYLFPEVLLVAEDYIQNNWKKERKRICKYKEYKSKQEFINREYRLDHGELRIYPCWVLPPSEVVRIMVETGIIE